MASLIPLSAGVIDLSCPSKLAQRQHGGRAADRPRVRRQPDGEEQSALVSVREGPEVGDDRGFLGRAEAEVSELDGVDVRRDLGGGPAVGLQRLRLRVGTRAPGKHVAVSY